MADRYLARKVFGALVLFFLGQLFLLWTKLEGFDERKMSIEDAIRKLERKKEGLETIVSDQERNEHRLRLRIEELENQLRDRLRLLRSPSSAGSSLPTIYFVTPTAFRAEQRPDLVRLSQTLVQVPNLHWIVVEDADITSRSVGEIVKGTRLPYAHIAAKTPPDMKMRPTDPNWRLPRGVEQRNAALRWIRNQLSEAKSGVVYFGDDDNTYDLRLFNEMRRVKKAGYWPVGIVGGLFVERADLHPNGSVGAFNAIWKPERPFPIDMASFAVNLTLILEHPDSGFSYEVPRGYQESHFLQSIGISSAEGLEPLADGLSRVLVWHTRTERSRFHKNETLRLDGSNLLAIEKDALGID